MPDADALTELSKRLDGLTQALGELRADLREVRREVQAGDAALRQEIALVRQEMQAYFRWTITTMVALFAVAVPIWIVVISFVLQRLLR